MTEGDPYLAAQEKAKRKEQTGETVPDDHPALYELPIVPPNPPKPEQSSEPEQ